MAPIDTTISSFPSYVFNKLSRSKKRKLNAHDVLLAETSSNKIAKMSGFHHNHLHHNSYMTLSNGIGGKSNDYNNSSSSKYASSTSSLSNTNSTSLSSKSPSIASLCNLGNTCFLNSVLYTLRFTPGFLHNLHHMVQDLIHHNNTNSTVASNNGKKKGSNILNSLTNGHSAESDSDGENMGHEIIEQLHDLFKTLSVADESSDTREPIPPSRFLNAVGKLNPLFEGNQQQDAHELLVMILNILEDIKIPAATTSTSQESDKIDSNPSDKKSKKKTNNNNSKPNNLPNGTAGNHVSNGVVDAKIHANPSTLPNFVRDNFEGKSVMRTVCLECESSTFQSETFTFIDVPLHFDEDDEELSGKDLFLKQITMSETLRENNKYWCEECSRLNEAQRSVEYELLPNVMVLQLKRFTATGSKYMSKINDFIPTPFSMNCFCHQCMPNPKRQAKQHQARHHYRLYAVIMHLGATLASGHYIAYVRASQDIGLDYSQCQRGGTAERIKNKKGIMKFLRRKDDSKSSDMNNHFTLDTSASSGCKSAVCCGIRGTLTSNNTTFDVSFGSSSSLIHQRSSTESCSTESSPDLDDLWLECDDESIQVISRKQFEDILSAKQGSATTPYLLFYQKV